MKFFNTTGPCQPDEHYMLPPAERLVGAQLHRYVRDKLYWTLHAPRQTGKTTFALAWMRELNAGGEYAACYVNIERCQGVKGTRKAMPNIAEAIRGWASFCGLPVPERNPGPPESILNTMMIAFAEAVAPKPLVMFFDEVDVLERDVTANFLRQLRDGFARRGPGMFPVSIALVAVRDLKDYITEAKGDGRVNPGSPFNIKEDSVLINNFSQDDLSRLFAKRTEETGQRITPGALAYAWEQSCGQPWIVNSLFKRATMRVMDENDFSTVELRHVQAAREQIVESRETHLDALEYRLDNPGVRHVVATLINGEPDLDFVNTDGFRAAQDLGLVAVVDGELTVANPIYREILARRLTHATQVNIPHPDNFRWRAPDGSLDMAALLREFQAFWRENAEAWEEKTPYTEVFPQLLLMAFLQRITNGGGHIAREYALGRGRLDLLVEFEGTRNIIEIKILRDRVSPGRLLETGLAQVRRYRDGISPGVPAYLLIFDRRSADKQPSWDERVYWRVMDDGVAIVGL